MKRRTMITGSATMLAAFALSTTARAESPDAAVEHITGVFEEYYVETETDAPPRVDVEAAMAAGESGDVVTAAETYNAYLDAYSTPEGSAARRPPIPVYGNWCGPGHSGPAAPIDLLDRMCKNHDECYGRKGYYDCGCDQGLIYIINEEWGKLNAEQKAVGAGIIAAISALMTVNGCS